MNFEQKDEHLNSRVRILLHMINFYKKFNKNKINKSNKEIKELEKILEDDPQVFI